jgi:hypothetical protein
LEEAPVARGVHLPNLHQQNLSQQREPVQLKTDKRIIFACAFSSWLNFGLSPPQFFSVYLEGFTDSLTYEKGHDFFSGPFLGKHLSTVTLEE